MSNTVRNGFFNISVMVMVLLSGAWFPSVAAETVPVIHIDGTAHSFPPVFEGKTLSHDFFVFNRGGEDLKIKKVTHQ